MEQWQFKFPTWEGCENFTYTFRDATRLDRDGGFHTSVTEWDGNTPICCGHRGVRVDGEAAGVAGAKKFDSDKPMMNLLFDGMPSALLQVGAVLTYGFKKYGGAHGWKSLPDAVTRYEAAMLRHQLAAASGEVNDPESGFPHAAHIACNALFLAELKQEKLNATQK